MADVSKVLLPVVLLLGIFAAGGQPFLVDNLFSNFLLTPIVYAEDGGDQGTDDGSKGGDLSGSVVHGTGVIQTRAGEGFSQVFCFPSGSSDPTEIDCVNGGVDQLGLLDIGISRDGVIRTAVQGNLATVETAAFYTANGATLQRSQAIYKDTEEIIRISQVAQTVPGSNNILYTLQATNIGDSVINDLTIAAYTDWDVDNTSDLDTAQYDATTDTAFVFQSAFVGISSPVPSSAHHLDFFGAPEIANAGVVLGGPNNAAGPLGPGDVTASLAWNLSSLGPGQSVSIPVILAAGNSLDELNSELASAKAGAAQTAVVSTPLIEQLSAGDTLAVEVPDTGTASTIEQLNIPLAVDGRNVSFTVGVTEVLPAGLPDPTVADAEFGLTLFLDLDFTDPSISGIDFSDPATFLTNPTIALLVNKNLDADIIEGDSFNCPQVTVLVFNDATLTWESVLFVDRDPSADVGVGTPATDDDVCGYLVTHNHFSKFSIGGIKKPSGRGGSDVFARTGVAFNDRNLDNYDDQAPVFGQVTTASGSLKVSAQISDNVAVMDANLVVGKSVYPMMRHAGNPLWWVGTIPSEDLSGGDVSYTIIARDFNKNTAEYEGTAEGPVGGSLRTSQQGSSFVIMPLTAGTEGAYSIAATSMRPGEENAQLKPEITIKNTSDKPLNNIRLTLSSELKGKFLLSDYAVRSIAPHSEYTISLILNGRPNVDVMNNPIPYNGRIIVSVDNKSPYVLELNGEIPNQSGLLQGIFMKMLQSKAEDRYKSFVTEKPVERIAGDAKLDITLGSGDNIIRTADDELIIKNTGDNALKNVRIMTSSTSDHFILDKKNIEMLPAGAFMKVKLNSNLNNAVSKDLHGELIIVPENGAPVSIPINIDRKVVQDRNAMYEVRTASADMSGNNAISSTADAIIIRNNSDETIDNVRIILPRELTRVFSISDDSFKSIEPNSEKIINIKLRGTANSNVKQMLNNYVGEITIVSSDGMKKIVPVNIAWKSIASKHFMVYARDNVDELNKATQLINFLEGMYGKVTDMIGEEKGNSRSVIYMTNSLDELEMLTNASDEDLAFIWSNSDMNIDALKQFAYGTIMHNYASYWTKQDIASDGSNWLVDGISNYVAASIVGERGVIKDDINSFIAQPRAFEYQDGATAPYTFIKFLAQKYGDDIIHDALTHLGSTMISSDGCNTFEQCVVLRAVYDANGLNMNDKRHPITFESIVEEWNNYVMEEYGTSTERSGISINN